MSCRGVVPAWLLVLALVAPALVHPGEPDIELMLEASPPLLTGQVAEAVPPTFVLLESGVFYLGGTSEILHGRLEGVELNELRQLKKRVEKLKGLGQEVSFGPGDERFRLRLKKDREIVATGDPDGAPLPLRLLATLITTLAEFDHPSCSLYLPSRYRLIVQQGRLIGGCRPWTLPLSIVDALPARRVIPASEVAGWPTGANPASVCAGNRTYVVALRPLLPWE
jgi:hypothetical protein